MFPLSQAPRDAYQRCAQIRFQERSRDPCTFCCASFFEKKNKFCEQKEQKFREEKEQKFREQKDLPSLHQGAAAKSVALASLHRGTSRTRKRNPLARGVGIFKGGESQGGGRFLMGEVLL